MLQLLTVKNFRKLTDHSFDFAPGLNVVRGQNEAGKSTMLEAMQYAMFGSKALRAPIAEVVTWGEPESSMKVELVFTLENVQYTIKRTKASAELKYDGGSVTGQDKVSEFVGDLLGTGTKAATDLMVANQNAIRGAISGGDGKSYELIEKLANLAVLDDLIELVRESLPTGADVAVKARLAQAEAALASLGEPPCPTSLASLEAELASTNAAIEQEKKAVIALEEAYKPLNEQYGQMLLAQKNYEDVLKQKAALDADAAQIRTSLNAIVIPAAPTDTELEAAAQAVQNSKRLDALKAALEKQRQYAASAETAVAGGSGPLNMNIASFETSVGNLRQTINTLTVKVESIKADIRLSESKLVSGSACGLCGKDVSNIPEVIEKNAEIQFDIGNNKLALADTERQLDQARLALDETTEIAGLIKGARDIVSQYGEFLELVDNQVPPTLKSKFADEITGLDTAAATEKLRNLQAQKSLHDSLTARYDTLLEAHDAKLAQALLLTVPAKPDTDAADALASKLAQMSDDHTTAENRVAELRAVANTLINQLGGMRQAVAVYATQKKSLQDAIDACNKELVDLAFNNALVKKVREVRPMVANNLWNRLLAAVSSYFSQMRGSPSVVTKGDGGFKVDGKPTASFSGSTLDALGLALRLALTKAFAPHVSMLVLDEPMAAMDVDRTLNTLAFISAAGFNQILLVTHEEESTTSAAHVINI